MIQIHRSATALKRVTWKTKNLYEVADPFKYYVHPHIYVCMYTYTWLWMILQVVPHLLGDKFRALKPRAWPGEGNLILVQIWIRWWIQVFFLHCSMGLFSTVSLIPQRNKIHGSWWETSGIIRGLIFTSVKTWMQTATGRFKATHCTKAYCHSKKTWN